MTSWPPSRELYRCHDGRFSGEAFNPGAGNGGRFHWFDDEAGTSVPVLYAADSYEGVIAETVFRNVPLAGRRTVYRRSYLGRAVTKLRLDPTAALELVELHDPGLLRIGVRPHQLTATNSSHYQRTKVWAQAIHRQMRTAQGLVWISGRFNTAKAIVLFGDRVDPSVLQVVPGSREPVDSGAGLDRLVSLAKSVDITVARKIP